MASYTEQHNEICATMAREQASYDRLLNNPELTSEERDDATFIHEQMKLLGEALLEMLDLIAVEMQESETPR